MAVYCFTCPNCGRGRETPVREAVRCQCGFYDKRDYPAERVGFSGMAEMKKQREMGTDGLSGRKAQRDLFLPTAREMRTKADPTGQKGIREWAETHGPRPNNKKPLYPEMDRKVY